MLPIEPLRIELHTRRLVLRPPQAQDIDFLFAMASDPLFAFFALRREVTYEEMADRVTHRIARPWSDGPDFVITHEGKVLGDIRLDIDHPNALAELGYGLAREYWGNGLMTEAAQVVITYAFHTFGMAKIWARADPRNVGSVRVLEKLGMKHEGLLRQHFIRRGERVDRVYFGLLREEWTALNITVDDRHDLS